MTTLTVSRNTADSRFHIVCLFIGQLLTFISTFYWNADGRHDVNASTLIVVSMAFWAAGLPGLFEMFRDNSVWYARIGLVYAMYGCLGGAAFGLEGLFSIILHNGDKIGVEAQRLFPVQLNLVLFWAGPAFPLSLVVLGIMFMVRKVASIPVGVLFILAGIGFPLSRILRIEWIAHLDDFALLSAIVLLGWPSKRE